MITRANTLVRTFLLMILFVVGFFTASSSVFAFSGAGTGVSGDPYLVSTCAELLEVDSGLAAEYLVTADLDCTANANDAMVAGTFTGVFDGGGHTITLAINSTDNNVGLFSSMSGATVSDVLITGSIITTGNTIGGIAGTASSATITRVANTATIRGAYYSGGILGTGTSVSLSDSYNTGDVSNSSSQTLGGIVAFIGGTSTLTRTYNRGVIGKSDESRYHVGGLIGQRTSTSTSVTNNFNVGEVLTSQSTFFFGGIWGNDISSGASTLASGWTNNFFDATRSTRTMCGYGNDGSNMGTVSGQCESVNTGADNYNYFKNNSTNAPLDTWNFDTIWETNVGGYPSLRSIAGDGGAVNDSPVEEDVTPPTLESITPADEATDVALDTNIVLTFDEPVVVGTGYITLATGSNDLLVENIDVTSDQVTGSGTTTITINPAYNFLESTTIFVNVAGTAFDDESGNSFAGFTGNNAKTFTTLDATAPVLTEVSRLPRYLPRDHDGFYRFTTSETCDIEASQPTSTTGNVTLFFEVPVPDQEISGTLDGMQAGGTYSFSFSCVDQAGNRSNTLSTGLFTVYNPQSRQVIGSVVIPTTTTPTLGDPTNKTCPADQILTQNLHAPSQNGKYNSYTKAVVTEAKKLQEHLNRLGFNSGLVDGFLGPISDGAIKRMQVFLKTTPDGYVGPITRGLINSSCK